MTRRIAAMAFWAIFFAAVACGGEPEKGSKTPSRKKVLIELFTSQGCDSCPPAANLMGRLADLGFGPDKIVPIAFHVDYFNEPWHDPFSNPEFSRRQMSYNSVLHRDDLYFTPMLMVDGRYPMLGSNQPKVVPAIRAALADKPGVSLDLAVAADGPGAKLSVELAARASTVVGRDLLVGVAVTEDPVTTDIRSGENAGKTLIEHHAVRAFHHQFVRLNRGESRKAVFPLTLGAECVPAHCSVAVFVQDRANGKVYQADSSPWPAR